MTVRNNKLRLGNLTSSEIVAILSMGSRDMTEQELIDWKIANPKSRKKTIESWPGDACITYIEECNYERKLARPIENESRARPLSWGKLVEGRVFNLLGIEYKLVSEETIVHPEINYWSGSPDANKFDEGKTVVDIKCPITLKSFCQLVDCLYGMELTELSAMNHIRETHRDGEKYYWQLVSNAILTNSKNAELIVYCPYQSELEAIREIIQTGDGEMQAKYSWINWANDDELPWLQDGGYYKNINVIRFEVPESDKEILKQRVLQCGELLIKIESKLEETLPVGESL